MLLPTQAVLTVWGLLSPVPRTQTKILHTGLHWTTQGEQQYNTTILQTTILQYHNTTILQNHNITSKQHLPIHQYKTATVQAGNREDKNTKDCRIDKLILA